MIVSLYTCDDSFTLYAMIVIKYTLIIDNNRVDHGTPTTACTHHRTRFGTKNYHSNTQHIIAIIVAKIIIISIIILLIHASMALSKAAFHQKDMTLLVVDDCSVPSIIYRRQDRTLSAPRPTAVPPILLLLSQ